MPFTYILTFMALMLALFILFGCVL